MIFKREQACQWYAEMYELTKLTETEKNEAWKQFAIEQVIKKAKLLGAPTESELKLKQAETRQQNGQVKLGEELRGT